MTTRTLLAAAITAFSFAAAPQAYAGLTANDTDLHGKSPVGLSWLGMDEPAPCGSAPNAADTSAQPVIKTIVLPNGRQLNLR